MKDKMFPLKVFLTLELFQLGTLYFFGITTYRSFNFNTNPSSLTPILVWQITLQLKQITKAKNLTIEYLLFLTF